jgi:hypothetical protein
MKTGTIVQGVQRRRFQKTAFGLLLLSVLGFTTVFASEYYKVSNVKRLDQNLYRSSSGLYIQTQFCFHLTLGEDAILKWEGKYGDNKIFWADDSTCQVVSIWNR